MNVIRILSVLILCVGSGLSQQLVDFKYWQFKPGDNLEWATVSYNDSDWKAIRIGTNWASQGYSDGGYGWYRIKFELPEMPKDQIESGIICFSLGKIVDYDQTFLNGKPIGENGRIIGSDVRGELNSMRMEQKAPYRDRNYTVRVDDGRLLWGKENVLAVRVLNATGRGGMVTSPVELRKSDIRDCLVIDEEAKEPTHQVGGIVSKTIQLRNVSAIPKIRGKLTIAIINQESLKTVSKRDYDVDMSRSESSFTFEFKSDLKARLKATYTFTETSSGKSITKTEVFPYILTPRPPETPRINGAKIVGVSVDRDFLFRIAASGVRPMTFSAADLPPGLVLDSETGIISGRVKSPGKYVVKLKAKNQKGEAVRDLEIVCGGLLALTPPMGWNSWNGLGYDVTEDDVRNTVDLLNSSGLAEHGWTYVNVDIGWEPVTRNPDGTITPNTKFHDMKRLVDYIHSNGFKAGIYISAGPKACSVYGVELGIGSYEHEEADAQTFAKWGFDYLKYDWCTYPGTDRSPAGLQKPFKTMKAALDKTDRDFVFSLGGFDSWEWGGSVGGNLWRVVSDVEDNWKSVKKGFGMEFNAPYAKPGNWNDPDMLAVGYGWFGDNTMRQHPTLLTPDEQYTMISLWSLLSAPLLIGCDLTKLDQFTLNLLSNDEVIAIDQDPLGKQALPVIKNSERVIMLKELEDGSKAVGIFNTSDSDSEMEVDWAGIGLKANQSVRDLWRQKDLGLHKDRIKTFVPAHGVKLIRIWAK